MAGATATLNQTASRPPGHGPDEPSIAVLPDGGWVLVWRAEGSGRSEPGLVLTRFDRHGVPQPPGEMPVNVRSAGRPLDPVATALADGGFVVCWRAEDRNGRSLGIYSRRFHPGGAPRAPTETLISRATGKGRLSGPLVTALPSGGYVVTWGSENHNGHVLWILQQAYDASGQALAPADILVNGRTVGWQFDVSVAPLQDGGWVVAWEAFEKDSNHPGIFQQRFGPDGSAQFGTEAAVHVDQADWQFEPFVTPLRSGGWVVTWGALDPDQVSLGVHQRAYTAQGTARSAAETPVNTTPVGWRFKPVVSALPDGGWVSVWMSESRSGASWGVYQRRYDAAGAARALQGHLTEAGTEVLHPPVCTRLAEGGLVLTWTARDPEGESWSVHQRYYASQSLHEGPRAIAVATSAQGWQSRPTIVPLPDGGWLVLMAERGARDGPEGELVLRRFDIDGASVPTP
jgi:hypothetical protein